MEIVYERIAAIDVGPKEVTLTPGFPGLLRGSFIPPGEIAAILELTRYRKTSSR